MSTPKYTADNSLFVYSFHSLFTARYENKLDFYPAGDHEFPVHFLLPGKIPSSFESQHGIVKYYIAGSVQFKKKTQIVCVKDLRVIYPINLSMDITNSVYWLSYIIRLTGLIIYTKTVNIIRFNFILVIDLCYK